MKEKKSRFRAFTMEAKKWNMMDEKGTDYKQETKRTNIFTMSVCRPRPSSVF